MKTKKELNELKKELETLSGKLNALSDDELEAVTGGNQVRINTSYLILPLNETEENVSMQLCDNAR